MMDKSRRTSVLVENGFHIDKALVLQEAKQYFMATSAKTKKLVEIISKCIFLILQGEQLAQKEATDLFFHMTRLFQYKDKDCTLRRLTYIGIKALSQQAENVYVVTSSLTNDVISQRDDPAIRASALRALCYISDPTNLLSIESYLKQSVVDKNPVVASAAVTSLVRIAANTNIDIVRRLSSEIHMALNSGSPMVQYHALGLIYNSCKNDKLAVSQLIGDCIERGVIKSPLAMCLLIRIISSISDEESQTYCDYIATQLTNKSEMVQFEAANALVNLECLKNESSDKKSAVAHMRNFLSSPKSALRFAAVRSLNQLNASTSNDIRFWSVHRIGSVCKLHLLNKRYKIGDQIIGILDFSDSTQNCAMCTIIFQCEELERYELKQEFCLGLAKNDFILTIPLFNTKASILHCVLSFLFYIADKNYPRMLFEDGAGTIESGPHELDTKLFSCDLPIAIHT